MRGDTADLGLGHGYWGLILHQVETLGMEQGCGEGDLTPTRSCCRVTLSRSPPYPHLPPLIAQTDKGCTGDRCQDGRSERPKKGVGDRQEDGRAGSGSGGWVEVEMATLWAQTGC